MEGKKDRHASGSPVQVAEANIRFKEIGKAYEHLSKRVNSSPNQSSKGNSKPFHSHKSYTEKPSSYGSSAHKGTWSGKSNFGKGVFEESDEELSSEEDEDFFDFFFARANGFSRSTSGGFGGRGSGRGSNPFSKPSNAYTNPFKSPGGAGGTNKNQSSSNPFSGKYANSPNSGNKNKGASPSQKNTNTNFKNAKNPFEAASNKQQQRGKGAKQDEGKLTKNQEKYLKEMKQFTEAEIAEAIELEFIEEFLDDFFERKFYFNIFLSTNGFAWLKDLLEKNKKNLEFIWNRISAKSVEMTLFGDKNSFSKFSYPNWDSIHSKLFLWEKKLKFTVAIQRENFLKIISEMNSKYPSKMFVELTKDTNPNEKNATDNCRFYYFQNNHNEQEISKIKNLLTNYINNSRVYVTKIQTKYLNRFSILDKIKEDYSVQFVKKNPYYYSTTRENSTADMGKALFSSIEELDKQIQMGDKFKMNLLYLYSPCSGEPFEKVLFFETLNYYFGNKKIIWEIQFPQGREIVFFGERSTVKFLNKFWRDNNYTTIRMCNLPENLYNFIEKEQAKHPLIHIKLIKHNRKGNFGEVFATSFVYEQLESWKRKMDNFLALYEKYKITVLPFYLPSSIDMDIKQKKISCQKCFGEKFATLKVAIFDAMTISEVVAVIEKKVGTGKLKKVIYNNSEIIFNASKTKKTQENAEESESKKEYPVDTKLQEFNLKKHFLSYKVFSDFKIFIKNPFFSQMAVSVCLTDTIRDIKYKIHKKLKMPFSGEFLLNFQGITLENEKQLKDYETVVENACVDVLFSFIAPNQGFNQPIMQLISCSTCFQRILSISRGFLASPQQITSFNFISEEQDFDPCADFVGFVFWSTINSLSKESNLIFNDYQFSPGQIFVRNAAERDVSVDPEVNQDWICWVLFPEDPVPPNNFLGTFFSVMEDKLTLFPVGFGALEEKSVSFQHDLLLNLISNYLKNAHFRISVASLSLDSQQ